MSDIAIKVENISKKYQIGENKNFPTLRDKLMELPNRLFKGPKKNKEFWALKDVSFEVKKGEVVGIIGSNGAGKSTLLKILARITEPTSGKITMYGRVASMLEVGTGFNPELTGRENIYLNGAIIGMTGKEINQKFNDIVKFSGVDKFLDTPVKHYSSGMYVRLAFAVAAHLDADILLVDEVLAVGDAEFQKKCLGKMSDLARSGRTVILVSHNLGSISSLCQSCVLVEDGQLLEYGRTDDVLGKYGSLNYKISKNINTTIDDSCRRIAKENTQFKFTNFSILNSKGQNTRSLKYQERFSIVLEGVLQSDTDDFKVGIGVINQNGIAVYNSHTVDSIKGYSYKKGIIKFINIYEMNILTPGIYSIGIAASGKIIQDSIPEIALLEIQSLGIKKNSTLRPDHYGVIVYPCIWNIINK